jgi:hypothetical protein
MQSIFIYVGFKGFHGGEHEECRVNNRLTFPRSRYFFYPEDGGDTSLRNIGFYKTHTLPHPRRRHFPIFVHFRMTNEFLVW